MASAGSDGVVTVAVLAHSSTATLSCDRARRSG
jgi:hypothetical protein